MAFDITLTAENGHCSRCGRPDERCGSRYDLVIRPHEKSRLEPTKFDDGICKPCFREIAHAIIYHDKGDGDGKA